MRTRGLWSVQSRLGPIVKILGKWVRQGRTITVLEIGCGHGFAMMQLKKKLPELMVMGMNVEKYGRQLHNQKYIYGDAGKKSRFHPILLILFIPFRPVVLFRIK